MKIIYAQETISLEGKSIFLAGPTPRAKEVKSWRPQAIKIFRDINFQGTVLIPEFKNHSSTFAYKSQIEWELEVMEKVDIILFWIPRELKDMPGFTTNTEFGYWIAKNPNKIVLGIPDNAPKCDYIKYLARTKGIQIHNYLSDTIKESSCKKN